MRVPAPPDHALVVDVDDDASLVLEIYPLTLAQLYFDGVLPEDPDVPVEVRVGRRKPSRWRMHALEMQENRWQEHVMVLRLPPA